MDSDVRESHSVSESFKLLIENGQNSNFWSEDWSGRGALKLQFPRIFALTIKKDGPISSFGQWEDGGWSWNVRLKRVPLD